jgi:hypothetical protein
MVWFWCGGSGLYFGTQPIDFFSLPFYSSFTAILPVNKKQEERQGNEIHNTRSIIGKLSCLKNMTTALIQYS